MPCYNEAERLDAAAFATFLMNHEDCDLLFVNDGSSDQTIAVLTVLATAHSNASVYDLEANLGKGEAVRRGLSEAIERGLYEYVGFMDADLATPAEDVWALREELANNGNLQLVLGSRWHHLGAKIERSPSRHYMGRMFATLATHVTGLDAYDTQCGAKLFRVNPTLRSILAEPFLTRWIFDIEVLARWLRLRTAERGRVAHFIRHVERDMRHRVRKVNEKLAVLVLLDEIDRLLRVAARHGPLVDGKLDDFLVLHQGRLPLGEGRFGIRPEDVHPVGSSLGFPLVVGVVHVV